VDGNYSGRAGWPGMTYRRDWRNCNKSARAIVTIDGFGWC
jgi:hypothetical protein